MRSKPVVYELNNDYIAVSKSAFRFIQAQLRLIDELNKRLATASLSNSPGVPPAPGLNVHEKLCEVMSV